MSVNLVGAFPLGGINLAASASVGITAPLIAQLDATLFGPTGIGSFQADISAQFSAALSSQVSLGLQISNPANAFQSLISLLANIQGSIALGLPAVSLNANASLAASIASAAALGVKLGGISALVEAALSVKLPAVRFLSDLQGSLAAGPVALISFGITGSGGSATDLLGSVGGQLDTLFNTVGGVPGFNPSDPVFGIIFLTKTPSAKAALMATFKTF